MSVIDQAQGRVKGVFLSLFCTGFAFMASRIYPSVWMNLVVLLMIGWFICSIYKMSLDRL